MSCLSSFNPHVNYCLMTKSTHFHLSNRNLKAECKKKVLIVSSVFIFLTVKASNTSNNLEYNY